MLKLTIYWSTAIPQSFSNYLFPIGLLSLLKSLALTKERNRNSCFIGFSIKGRIVTLKLLVSPFTINSLSSLNISFS